MTIEHKSGVINLEKTTQVLPAAALRGTVIFPYMKATFDFSRTADINAATEAWRKDKRLLLVTQREAQKENIEPADLYKVGTVSMIENIFNLPNNSVRVAVRGVSRGIIDGCVQRKPYMACTIEERQELYSSANETEEAYCREIKSRMQAYIAANPRFTPDKYLSIVQIKHLGRLCDVVAAMLNMDVDIKQELLEEFNYVNRASELLSNLEHLEALQVIELQIAEATTIRMSEHQREHFLREQMQVIRDQLGDSESVEDDAKEFLKQIEESGMSEENAEKLTKVVHRFSRMPIVSSDSSVLRTYIETVLDLPWHDCENTDIDIKRAERILEEEHYGLKEVKERILEYLAVRSMTGGKNTTVLCLEGPPGVGKTSVAKSIAHALDRKFVRISLGGIHDESDIRGHRKTYIGAMEGRIMSAMREAKVKNPMILLDEIDKMGRDYKGDPSAALLEVLDNEQNNEFRDHYIELPYDLSDVLFVTTANTLETISQPLLDRMEIIRLSGYTGAEKFHIAKDYLYKKALAKTGMTRSQVKISDGAINKIIESYTREAGVRKLEQALESLCRKAAKHILDTGEKSVSVTIRTLPDMLGKEKFRFDGMNKSDEIGVARGLAWTSVGGETLSVEANVMSGTGKIELTGKLGDVMKESARAAISYIRASADKLNIDDSFYENTDIHIHVPEGAVPKDGPSAGITMATAVISSLTQRPVRRDIAMTGEITLRGRVLPIGGLKEKSMAAYRAGIRTLIIPEGNKPDIDEVPEEIRDDITFITASGMDTVIENALI